MKKLLVLALVSGLVACASTPEEEEKEVEEPDAFDKSGFVSGIGPVSGALGGLLIGDGYKDTRSILIGAGIGAIAGGGIGLYMDNQERDLRAELDNSGVLVTRLSNKIIINLPSNITFATGQSDVRPEFFTALTSIARVLSKYNKTILDVNGHTDDVGGVEFNHKLSEQRASSVANYVVSKGINERRVRVRGFGEVAPVASNQTESGRAANRRVEISIVPTQQY